VPQAEALRLIPAVRYPIAGEESRGRDLARHEGGEMTIHGPFCLTPAIYGRGKRYQLPASLHWRMIA